MDYIFGYTVANDINARDWYGSSINGGQVLICTAMDGFCPIGPVIVTKDEMSGS